MIKIIFIAAVGIVFFLLYGYRYIIEKIAKKCFHKRIENLPSLTIIVPCRDEEKNIASKIENLLSGDYPIDKRDIIIVDNESTDQTANIARTFPVKVISSTKGKINAINAALQCATTDVIALTDADVRLSSSALKNGISLLHGKIGAVSGMVHLTKRRKWYMNAKLGYHDKDWALRYQEGLVDSCCSLDGKLIIFRKSLVEKIPPDAYIDDFELTFLIRKKGFRCIVDNQIGVYEQPAVNLKEELRQMRRRIGHGILTIYRHRDMLFNKRYGYFGLLIIPSRRVLPLFLPVYIFIISFYSMFIFKELMIPFLTILAVFLFIKKETVLYNATLLATIILAWYDIIFKKYEKGGTFERINNL